MTDDIIAAGKDAWTTTAASDTPHPEPKRPRLKSGVSRTFVFLPCKRKVEGKTVSSAVYSVPVRGSVAAQTITVSPITESWSPSTLTSNHTPAHDTGAAVADAQGALTDGQRIQVDVTSLVQAIAAGADDYGFRITTTSSTEFKLYGFASGQDSHRLEIEYADPAEPPTIIAPLGGSTVLEPVISWEAGDFGDEDTVQSASRVQVNAGGPDTISPDYDSGSVANTASEWDMSTAVGFTGVNGTTYYARVELNGNGQWSDWISWTAQTPVVPSISSPAAVAWDPTLTLAGSVTGGTIQQYRWQIFATLTGTKRYDSGWLPGAGATSVSTAVPEKWRGRRVHVDDREYEARFLVRDRTDRTPSGDDPGYVSATQVYTFDDDFAPAAPTNLLVAPIGESPWTEWAWERTTGGTLKWVFGVGDNVIAVVDAADESIETVGTSHTWRTPAVPAYVTNLCWVKAIDTTAGKRSQPAEAAFTYQLGGVWLASETDEALMVQLDGMDVSGFRNDDRRAIYSPVGLEYDIDIVYALRGLSGTFSGGFSKRLRTERNDRDWEADLATLRAMRSATDERVRLAYGTVNVPIILRNVSPGLPSQSFQLSNMEHTVTFEAQQVDEFGDD